MTIQRTVFLLTAGLALGPAEVIAQTTACSSDYEKAQEEKANGRLNAALSYLRGCVNPDCPKFIREDCARWMDQTESALPSVVFAVRRDGVDQTEVDIACDGVAMTRSLNGKAIPVDPGVHVFSFAMSGFDSIERRLLIREGERNRIVDVEFRSPRESATPAPAVDARNPPAGEATSGNAGRRYLTYGLAGAGVLGLAGFVVFAVRGVGQQGTLEKDCAPNCLQSDVDSVKTKYLVADTCLAVGLVSLGVATYLWFTSRGEKPSSADRKSGVSVGFSPRSLSAGGVLQLSTAY
jgi:hypothetical protein